MNNRGINKGLDLLMEAKYKQSQSIKFKKESQSLIDEAQSFVGDFIRKAKGLDSEGFFVDSYYGKVLFEKANISLFNDGSLRVVVLARKIKKDGTPYANTIEIDWYKNKAVIEELEEMITNRIKEQLK